MRRCAAGWKVGGGSWYRYLSIRVGCGVEWCGGILCILWGWRGKYTCARLLAGTILFRPTYERTLFNPQPGAFRFGPITTVESLRLDCNYGFGRNSDLGLYMSSLALQQSEIQRKVEIRGSLRKVRGDTCFLRGLSCIVSNSD